MEKTPPPLSLAAAIKPGDLLLAAAHAEHGFVERSEDFSEWIVFYGPPK